MIERYLEDELIAEQIERSGFQMLSFLSLRVCPKDTISLHKNFITQNDPIFC